MSLKLVEVRLLPSVPRVVVNRTNFDLCCFISNALFLGRGDAIVFYKCMSKMVESIAQALGSGSNVEGGLIGDPGHEDSKTAVSPTP